MPAPLRPDEPEPGPPQEIDHPLYQEQMNKLAAANQYETSGISAAVEHRPTVTEQLLHKKAYHEAELKRINEALAHALNNVPTMALLDSIAKVGLSR